MGQGNEKQKGLTRFAIPLTAGAIVTAQLTMAVATSVGGDFTEKGWGRKPLFLIGLASLPIRCALIILLQDAGHQFLLATQVLDGVGGGLFGLIHPFIVADITFGTGRFNAVSKYCALCMCYETFSIMLILFNFLFHSGLDCFRFWSGCYSIELFGTKGCGTLWSHY